MKDILDKLLDWYFNGETQKTPLQRLIKAILIVPLIVVIIIVLVGGLTYVTLIMSVAAIWTIIAALPYWILTNTIAPIFIDKHFLIPAKKILD